VTTLPDLVILGGGIAGLTSALSAAARGMRVTVIDQARLGAASRASAGLLAPSIAGLPESVRPTALEARDVYPRFLAMLRDRTDIEVPLDRQGILELAASESDLEQRAGRAGNAAVRLDARALAALEPAFAAHAGAMLHPHDGAVDNVTLMSALDVAVARHPRITRVTDEVASFDARGNLPAFRSRGGTRYASRRLLVAGGAWAGSLPGLPRPIPVRPVRGQLVRLEGLPIRHVTHMADGYLVPRTGAVIVGATSEETGFECHTTPRGLATLRAIATRAVPVLSHAPVADHWAGLRPITPDGLPVYGPDPIVPSLFYACGLSRNGILLAPWAADQLAALLAGGASTASLAPFRVERFSQPAPQ
jgi:glycine/D-amino acid oxidase-like deaminating enzyme